MTANARCGFSILCVDDREIVRYARNRVLRLHGFTVLEAGTGLEALRAAAEHKPDLILLDVDLPDISGFEVCRQLKADPAIAHIPVLHLSASRQDPGSLVVSGLDGGASGFLTEPVAPGVLVATIRAILRSRAADANDERSRDALKRIEWLLEREDGERPEIATPQPYGDLSSLNTCLVVLDSLGGDVLRDIARDYLDLLETSSAIYERNGDYALGLFASGWCRFLDQASRDLCRTPDNREALACGKWLCHEECWRASKRSMETGGGVDTECPGGIRLLALPIQAGGEVVGSINLGYGDPPINAAKLEEIAQKYKVSVDELRTRAQAYASRPPFIVRTAQRRLEGSARLIGALVQSRRAEHDAIQSSRRLKLHAENSPLGIVEWDREFKIISLNEEAARIFGWTADEIVGKRIDELRWIHEDDIPMVAKRMEDMITGRQPRNMNANRNYRRDGTIIHCEWYNSALLDSQGKLVSVLSQVLDVTERKRAEDAVRRLAQFPEENPNPVLRVAGDGVLLYANAPARAWLAAMGGAADQPLPDVVQKLVADVCQQQGAVEAEFSNDTGRTFWFAAVQPPGERYVNLYGRDITDRKRAEQKTSHQNAILEGMNRIFTDALVCDTDEELGRRCLAVAEALTESKFGFIAEINAEGRLDSIAISDPGWDACRIENPTGHRKVPAGFKIHGICGRVLLDGKGFYTNHPPSHPDSIGGPEGHPPLKAFLGLPLLHSGKTLGIIGVGNREGGYRQQDLEALEALAVAFTQVVMRQRAERAVRAGEEQLRQSQKLESIGLLAGGVAHDFNNLLTSILGNASLVIDDVPKRARARIEAVITGAEKAAHLTRQLLAYAGKGQFFVTDLDLSELVFETIDLVRVSVSKTVELRLDLPKDMPRIRADAGQVQQVVMNLVINASEAIGEHNNGTILIAAGLEDVHEPGGIVKPGRYVTLTVTDDGCGMSEETISKIFDPFFTTKAFGRGLGLSAVSGIMRLCSGAVTIDSRPGAGTKFKLLFPAVAAASREPQPVEEATDRGAGTVLVVEDEEALRDFIGSALRRAGYHVLLAADGQQAVDLVNAGRRIDLVLLDIVLPVMGGRETMARIREKYPDMKVLVTSGYGQDEVRRLCSAQMGTAFIQKPYTARQLIRKISAAMSAP